MKNSLLAMLCILLSASQLKAQNWTALGQDDKAYLSSTYSEKPHLLDLDGVMYVAYNDESPNDESRLLVKKLDPVSLKWVQLGSAVSLHSFANVSLAYDADKVLYIAYSDNEEMKVKVKKFDGQDWVFAGDQTLIDEDSDEPVLSSSGNTLFLAYRFHNAEQIRIQVFNGTAWAAVHQVSANMLEDMSFAAADNGDLYLAYTFTNQSGSHVLAVERYHALQWTRISDAAVAMRSYIFDIMLTTHENSAYLAYTNGDTEESALSVYNGVGWNIIGGSFASNASNICVAFDSFTHAPHVAYRDDSNSDYATVKRYFNNVWETLGAEGFNGGGIGRTFLAFEGGVIPYLAFEDKNNGDRVSVYRFMNQSWDSVSGSRGLGGSEGNYPNIAAVDETPYVSYYKDNNSSLGIMRFNSGTFLWEDIATPVPFNAGHPYHSLVSNNGILYFAYVDGDNSGRLQLYEYQPQSGWQQLSGSPSGINGTEYAMDMSLVFDNSGTFPYISFKDGMNQGKGRVVKFTGFSWESVGGHFSDGAADYTDIMFDESGAPYVAFRDIANSSRLSVVKFDSSTNAWVYVGNRGFTSSSAGYPTLSFVGGVPHVVFRQSGKIFARKYDLQNDSWDIVGDVSGVSDGDATYPSSLVAGGILYVQFEDEVNGVATVKRFVNGVWEVVSGVSAGEIGRNNLAMSASGKIYSAYTNSGIFVKQLGVGLLPVELISFTATTATTGVQLKWVTASEKNNRYFILESSADGVRFKHLATVPASGKVADHYTYTDYTSGTSVYYRLTQVDLDGKAVVYDDRIVFVKPALKVESLLMIYPNPATDVLKVRASGGYEGNYSFKLMDLQGRVLMSETASENEEVSFAVESLMPGIYLIEFSSSRVKEIRKFVKR